MLLHNIKWCFFNVKVAKVSTAPFFFFANFI